MPIEKILATQQAFFASGATLPYAFRRHALAKLYYAVKRYENDILEALQADLGKQPYEGYMTEVGLVLEDIRFLQKHLAGWMADKTVPTPLGNFASRSFVHKQPYGLCLIMAPWNYPFQLSVIPLAGAIAAGNCVVLKPSAYAPATSSVLRRLAQACFAPGHVQVVGGGRAQNTALLEQRFDHIFFTGSVEVGKQVMEKASKNLTPVVLELGGKSPCIVDGTADLKLAARRIAFGKFLNAGQTCVAPDYVLVQAEVKDELIRQLRQATLKFFGPQPLQNPELPRIVNEKHFNRLRGLLACETVAFGGGSDSAALRMEPTVLDAPSPHSPVMQEEIFGPILPVIPYQTLSQAIAFVNRRQKPLALYLFSNSKQVQQRVLQACSFGGGCINDTVVHLATSHMPFGGVGHSGMGSYHGKQSFDTFSHSASLLHKANWPDVPIRYHPYTNLKTWLLRRVLK